jgi:hypothetical protein
VAGAEVAARHAEAQKDDCPAGGNRCHQRTLSSRRDRKIPRGPRALRPGGLTPKPPGPVRYCACRITAASLAMPTRILSAGIVTNERRIVRTSGRLA